MIRPGHEIIIRIVKNAFVPDAMHIWEPVFV